MHKYCTSVVKLLLSHNIQYTRGTYLPSQNIPGVYFVICEKIPATPDKNITGKARSYWAIAKANAKFSFDVSCDWMSLNSSIEITGT